MALRTVVGKTSQGSESQALSSRGNGDLVPLTRLLTRQVLSQFGGLSAPDLHGYSFRSLLSDFPDAIADLEIFDANGRLVIQGRVFRGMTALWSVPASAATLPSWSHTREAYSPPRKSLF